MAGHRNKPHEVEWLFQKIFLVILWGNTLSILKAGIVNQKWLSLKINSLKNVFLSLYPNSRKKTYWLQRPLDISMLHFYGLVSQILSFLLLKIRKKKIVLLSFIRHQFLVEVCLNSKLVDCFSSHLKLNSLFDSSLKLANKIKNYFISIFRYPDHQTILNAIGYVSLLIVFMQRHSGLKLFSSALQLLLKTYQKIKKKFLVLWKKLPKT